MNQELVQIVLSWLLLGLLWQNTNCTQQTQYQEGNYSIPTSMHFNPWSVVKSRINIVKHPTKSLQLDIIRERTINHYPPHIFHNEIYFIVGRDGVE